MGEIRWDLGDLEPAVRSRLRHLTEQKVVERIWEKDHTVWGEDPTEIVDRLGWLHAVERSRGELDRIRRFVKEVRESGLAQSVLLGMGGSSLAAEVIRRTFFGTEHPPFDLAVLDTTHGDALARLEAEIPLDRALFLASSKSGTTIETRSHLAYFHDRHRSGSRFAAITDPGSPLEHEGTRLAFRGVFSSPADVGGRYSALTIFGLLPAALMGVDPELLLLEAAGAMRRCLPEAAVDENPAAVLGAVLGEAALAGRDKLTLVLPDDLAPFGAWMEQLVAESTGKDGTGIIPIDAEPRTTTYGDDRLFLAIGEPTDLMPSITVPFRRLADLGALFFLFEFAVAVAGSILRINPFDQPNVQEAKDRTDDMLSRNSNGSQPYGDLDALLESARPGGYVAMQAFVNPTPDAWKMLQAARGRILNRLGVATTLGFGPRYLHSTGQLHKGGPPGGVFVQVFEEPNEDREIPGRPYTFGQLISAQAAGDLAALRARGRPVARVAMEDLVAWEG
jgi:transaldolase / glucose-6-phosphate isomerase